MIIGTKKEPAQCRLQMNSMHVSGRNALFCAFRGRLRRGRLCGLCLVLRGEFLLDLDGDRSHVHLVELGGFAYGFAGFGGRSCWLENGQFDQQTAQCALVGLRRNAESSLAGASVPPFGLPRLCCLRMMARRRSSRTALSRRQGLRHILAPYFSAVNRGNNGMRNAPDPLWFADLRGLRFFRPRDSKFVEELGKVNAIVFARKMDKSGTKMKAAG